LIPLKDNLPTDRFPLVTVIIIVINVLVFLVFEGASFSGEQVKTKPVLEYGMIPYRVTHPGKDCGIKVEPDQLTGALTETGLVCQGTPEYRRARTDRQLENLSEAPSWLTIFTSMFLHGGWLHIIFNMLFLWIFGNNVEDSMGRLRFVFFYLIGGVVAALAQVGVSPDSTAPTVGASGAIAAVLGGYALLYPRARVLTIVFIFFFFTFIEIPAMIMLGIWFVLQFLPAVGQLASPDVAGQGGVAYFAHVGGFLSGLALIHLFAKRKSERYVEPRNPVF
jgi:membrane associated rhomboid family serine protease